MTENRPRRVELGLIVGAHGLRGWVKVKSYTRPQENILSFDEWPLFDQGPDSQNQGERRYKLVGGHRQGKGIVAHLAGVDDRDQAEALKGQAIRVERERLPEQEDGQYYWADLIGSSVVTADGQALGEVDHLIETGANDVMVVAGDKERLIPFLYGDSVQSVDLERGVIVVNWDPEF